MDRSKRKPTSVQNSPHASLWPHALMKSISAADGACQDSGVSVGGGAAGAPRDQAQLVSDVVGVPQWAEAAGMALDEPEEAEAPGAASCEEAPVSEGPAVAASVQSGGDAGEAFQGLAGKSGGGGGAPRTKVPVPVARGTRFRVGTVTVSVSALAAVASRRPRSSHSHLCSLWK